MSTSHKGSVSNAFKKNNKSALATHKSKLHPVKPTTTTKKSAILIRRKPAIKKSNRFIAPVAKSNMADWPPYISKGASRIPGAGWGIYAIQTIPKGMKLGTYKGELFKRALDADLDSAYIWEINVSDKIVWFVDAKDPRKSNWTRYVNCPRNTREENVQAKEEDRKIVYYSTRTIYPGEELYVWYGPSYGEQLGIGSELPEL